MALGDAVLFRQRSMEGMAGGQLGAQLSLSSVPHNMDELVQRTRVHADEAEEPAPQQDGETVAYLPPNLYLCDLRHDAGETSTSLGPAESGLVSKWRMKDRMKTGCVALVLCLNIGVDPPDVIKISPCARMECWIDPSSMLPLKAIDAIGKNLQVQYERWQPRARYRVQLDPTVEEVKKICTTSRKSAKNERVLFHYNGHGVPRPTVNGEIWLFNKSYTQYIPLSVYELESWLGTPSIYVFDCSAAGMIVNAFCDRPDYGGGNPSPHPAPAMKDCILLAACGAHEILPQNAELPADVFTSCLTTPIKIALRWFCPRSLLKDTLDPDLIDRIPGRQNDRKTPLGELNWIFTAITDTIAWNVLPRDLFQRLFRQDLLVASLFRNFLLAERIMRAANCSPQSYPALPPTHQHPMWHAWDMAAEICLSQLPALLSDSNLEFQPSPFFTEQLTAFEVWLEHGSSRKNPPEQLPIVLQVLLSQSHRFRALVLLGRFLDMGAWAVDLALSVGIFPYVLKLLQTTATELRQILVFIWTKILALDKSCQVDLVKDGGHQYFIKFLDSDDVCAEQRAMAAFVLAVIADGHPRGQSACIQAGLINICLVHIQTVPGAESQPEPLLLQWLCLCLGKLWDGAPEGQAAYRDNARTTLTSLLSELNPEVRASATYALGTLVKAHSESTIPTETSSVEDEEDEEALTSEREIARSLLKVINDGSPLVRTELAIALARLAIAHNRLFRAAASAYLKPPSSMLSPTFAASRNASYGYTQQLAFAGSSMMDQSAGLRVGLEGTTPPRPLRPVMSSGSLPSSGNLHGSPSELGYTEEARSLGNGPASNGVSRSWRLRGEESGIYVQCVAAVYALARDPSPRVASIGRQILRSVGVEVVVKPVRTNSGPGHTRNASVPALPPTPLPSGLVRSTSWVASTSGNLASTFRTPPPSPPSRPNFLTSPMGIRRVSSMEQFSSTASTPRDMGRIPIRISGEIGIATTSPVPRSVSATGLADGSGVPVGPASLSMESTVPTSTLYSWSCGHFSRPLLEPTHEDEDEVLARREERERVALDGMSKCQHSSVSKVSDPISSWVTLSEMGTKAVLLHPFSPLVCCADEKETIRIYNYEEEQLVNTFDNHNAPDKGVSKLCLLNELDDSLLLVASSDGSVRVWKDYTQKDNQRLATAFQTIQGHKPGSRGISAVVDWQQYTGLLYASGEISSITVWNLDTELCFATIPSQSDSCTSAMSASQVHTGQLATGCGDGFVRVYDIRTRGMLVCAMKAHSNRVMGIDFQPGMDLTKMVSASQSGDIKFLDIRNNASPYLSIDAHKGHLTSLAVHRHAPVIASGSSKSFIKVFSTSGEQLSMVRYHNSFLGHRIGPVSCLHFHPYSVLLAAGATDSIVSIYAGEMHSR
ncbi:regulatory associated protein of mTOR [Marchantia polymorpha subsp. ruderalis]|uniref:Raptor N-terminal CASPase-like domain-containing protein n=2 Tax=Marchantia polymorpha TaxID=3197 RepID=A0AAF6AUF1_MARPO|nr:hypothetical protein MARPO_0002s0262 [Marchantia polymorpha]BBN00072.1 hypothetical protein Mp_1g26150 [Marchantia polymorpha subsp. ruderalis]|eukprot:PTQ49812.1 hypothetical protein MARPO_0002s0262 [Marchantia polymorpha]